MIRSPLQATADRVAKAPDWVADTVFYQVFPDRFANGDTANDPPGVVDWDNAPTRENFFGGDLAGVIGKLDYLHELGVNGLYLTPVFRAGTNHRYDTHDYFEVDPVLGDNRLLRALADQAHKRGIRILLDGVFNHCGDGFWAFRDVIERGTTSPYYDWFFIDSLPITKDPPSYQACGGAYYLPKLNTDHPEVRKHLLAAATYWLREAGIDGWRIDVPWEVPLEFWLDLREAVKRERPDAYLVAEAWYEWSRLPEAFDGLMNYRLRKQLLNFCVLEAIDAQTLSCEVEMLLAETFQPHAMLNLLGSHDTARLLTLARGDERRAVIALTALFTLPGAPMLYYGDEVGMEGENDPECRRTMIWDRKRWRGTINIAIRRLIELRRNAPALRRGTYEPLFASNRIFAYARSDEVEHVIVVLNAGPAVSDLAISTGCADNARLRDALAGQTYELRRGLLELKWLREWSALVLRSDPGPEVQQLSRHQPVPD